MSFQDFRKTRRGLSPEEIRFLFVVLIGLVILLALNILLARVLPGGEWLYLRWSGARAFMFESVEPYSTIIAERVQQLVYGRTAFSSEYGYVLNDPFYIVLLYTPLAMFADFSIARGIWMLFAEAALIGTVLLTLRLLEWGPPRWILISLITFALFSYYNLQSLISNSPTIFLTFLFLSILLALRAFNDELAGGLLALVSYQWEVGALFVLFVIVFAIVHKRWGIFTGLGMALFVLLIVSFLSYPGWVLPYARATLSDWYRSVGINFNSILSGWFPESRFPLGGISAAVLLLLVLIEWIGAIQSHFRRIVWTVSLSLAATPLIGFPIFASNHVALFLPLVLILSLVWERWRKNRALASALVLSVVFISPFVLYFLSLSPARESYASLLSALPPLATIVGLYWMRWFAVRSPRTWLDQVGARQ